jgi:ribosomal protein S18 acetylase RimI-like enzyme
MPDNKVTSALSTQEPRTLGRGIGSGAAYARVMNRLARHAGLRVFRVFGRRLGAGAQGRPDALDYRFLSEGEVLALCADASLDLTAFNVRAAHGRGDLCVGVFERENLAGYCWFALSAAPHMDRAWLDFPSHLVYTYKSFVRPAFRGCGIAAAMYRFADPVFLARRRSEAVICVESHNWPSIAAAKRGGFSAAGYAAYVGGARLRAWCSRTAAGYGLRFYVPE